MIEIAVTETSATAAASRSWAPQMSRWTFALAALFCVSGVLASGTAYGQGKPKPKPAPAGQYRVFHVLSTKDTKARVPKPLKRFAKNLAKVGTSHKVVGKPEVVNLIAGKAHTIKLPKKLRKGLGKGTLLLTPDGSVTITLKPLKPKNLKDRIRMKSRVFPFYLIDEKRFRVDGELYLLIIEKLEPKKKKK